MITLKQFSDMWHINALYEIELMVCWDDPNEGQAGKHHGVSIYLRDLPSFVEQSTLKNRLIERFSIKDAGVCMELSDYEGDDNEG